MGRKAEQNLEIDAVGMTRRIRDAQHTQLEGRTWEERVAYYEAKAQELHRSLGRVRKLKARNQKAV
jgi:hypothetical protein